MAVVPVVVTSWVPPRLTEKPSLPTRKLVEALADVYAASPANDAVSPAVLGLPVTGISAPAPPDASVVPVADADPSRKPTPRPTTGAFVRASRSTACTGAGSETWPDVEPSYVSVVARLLTVTWKVRSAFAPPELARTLIGVDADLCGGRRPRERAAAGGGTARAADDRERDRLRRRASAAESGTARPLPQGVVWSGTGASVTGSSTGTTVIVTGAVVAVPDGSTAS